MKFCPFVLKILSGNEILAHFDFGTNVQKMTHNKPKLDLVNMNGYIKFGEKMSVSSQDIERKQNFGLSQVP